MLNKTCCFQVNYSFIHLKIMAFMFFRHMRILPMFFHPIHIKLLKWLERAAALLRQFFLLSLFLFNAQPLVCFHHFHNNDNAVHTKKK